MGPMRRVGSKNDGGYVIPCNLPQHKTLVSFGLGDDWSFETQLLRERCIEDFIFFDHTVTLSKLVSRLRSRIVIRNFSIKALLYRVLVLARYILDFKIRKKVHVRKEITQNENGPQKTNLLDISTSINAQEFILKVDIETGEYFLIDQICEMSSRIPLLIIEFHETEARRNQFQDSLSKLARHYIICHAHANNFNPIGRDGIPIALELTLGRKDIYYGVEGVNSLPLEGLDAPSSPSRADHKLTFI